MDSKTKISFRPGSLAQPLAAWCDKHDTTPSQAIREALSDMMGVFEPPMDGHVEAMRKINEAKREKKIKQKKA